MSGDPEKRFHKIMDKLYHAPKPRSSIPSGDGTGPLSRGKRPEPAFKGALEKRSRIPTAGLLPPPGLTPTCRPWDREDLMRRLATFKALTWFGKPKSVSPVNCARRGWTNIEMDVIACKACGARLLFSTPSSWTIEQVEKAAAVFSLKLDNGHKLLCPWIDNACDETLTLFPPMPPASLVVGYKERASALLRLTCLPVISSSAIDYMKSPQLENFLSQSIHPSITLSNGIKLIDGSGGKDLDSASEDVAADVYYQVLKIISSCGWEPRLLPYVVDSEDQSSLLAKSTDSSSGPDGLEGGKIIHSLVGEYQYDPACVVLDCRFCGACVGLWAFSTIQRPLEFFRLVADFSGQNELVACSSDVVCRAEDPNSGEGNRLSNNRISRNTYGGSSNKERPLGLNLTIAGGPPPTKQNFRPRISFPIISRHLRAGFDNIPGPENSVRSDISFRNEVNTRCIDVPLELQKDISSDFVVRPEGLGSLKRKRSEDEEKSNGCANIVEKVGCIFSEKRNYNLHDTPSLHEGSGNSENPQEAMQNRPDALQRDTCSKDSEKEVLNTERESDINVEVGESLCTTSNANEIIQVSEACENKTGLGLTDSSKSHDFVLPGLDLLHDGENSEKNQYDCSHGASYSTIDANLTSTHSLESANGGKGPAFQNLEVAQMNNQNANIFKNMMLSYINQAEAAGQASGNGLKRVRYNPIREFDPIMQHRPFCPWIASDDGGSLSGWKLTLSALIHEEKNSSNPSDLLNPSTLLDEVDDPIVSIRKLFMPPSTKRLKDTR